jgi:uncharacterized SAM-binding protein YcdF (DUF218 family)
MFFVLSKILLFLIMPYTIVCILFITSVLLRNPVWKKRTFWTAFAALLFFSNEFIANEVMRAWEVEARPFKTMRKYKVGVVLTGATLSGIEPDDRVYFHRGADRVVHTVQLYKLGLIEKIVISGGSGRLSGEDEPEANKFKKVMLLMEVPEQDIMIENQTRNTGESAIEVKKVLDSLGYRQDDCVLITSAFHMRRSLAAYRKSGVNMEPFSVDFYARPREFGLGELLIPQLDAMVKWQKLSKEWVGMVAYKIVGYV